MKKYQKYKDSGIVWIGEIPAHWNIIKLKRLSQVKRGASPRPIDDLKYFDENGEFSWVRISDLTASERYLLTTEEKLSELGASLSVKRYPGDFFLSIAGSVGKPIISKIKCCIHDGFVWFPDLKINPEYLYYLFQSGLPFGGLGKLGTQLNLNTETIGNIYIPDLSDQEIGKIVQYLDHQITIIDQLIQQKKKLIELLKEKRQAVINEAVTKGLNPNVKMKESGIEWLGKIPEQWELRNMEIVARKDRYSITGGPFGSDLKNEEYTEEGVRIIQLQNIGVGEFRDDYKIYTTEEKADYLFSSNIYPGEIIIAKMADPVARACIVPNTAKRFIMASDGIRLEVDKDKYNTRYIEFSINAKYFNYQAELNSTGTTRLRIGLTSLKKLKLLLPSLNEQNTIVEYLESYNQYYIETSQKLANQIEKLKEYHQSIISEAVTGKIDVKDWEPNKQKA
ncbi:MAG: restriction endonuclease subunit S [Bacteroidota bacterium]